MRGGPATRRGANAPPLLGTVLHAFRGGHRLHAETRRLGRATARDPCFLGLARLAVDVRSALRRSGHAAQSPVRGRGTGGTRLGQSGGLRGVQLQQQADTLLRNLYTETDEEGVTTTPPEAAAAALRLAGYVQAQLTHLRAIPTEEMLRARVSWAPDTFS